MSSVINDFNTVSQTLVTQLAWASLMGGLAILAALGLARSGFLPARLNCWFLRLSVLKLLVAAVFISPISIPLLSSQPQANVQRALRAMSNSSASTKNRLVRPNLTEEAPAIVLSSLESPPALALERLTNVEEAVQDGANRPSTSIWNWIAIVWFIGVVVQIVVFIVRFAQTLQMLRGARHASSRFVETTLHQLSQSMSVRRPVVLIHGDTGSPCVIGIRNPCVLVSDVIARESRLDVLRDVLAHELAHVRRRDLLWNLLPVTVSCLFYFHPLLWLLRRELAVQTEIATDELAMRASGCLPRQYAASLLGLVVLPSRQQEFLLGYGVTFRGLRRRIDSIYRHRDESWWRNCTARLAVIALALTCIVPWRLTVRAESSLRAQEDSTSEVLRAGDDWPQWGGTRLRNNVSGATNLARDWNVGRFNRATGEWDKRRAKNISWAADLGTQTYGNPVVAGGRVFVGTNNGSGYLKRFPSITDLGCLLAFDEKTGEFLWQHSSEKLITGRVHDWPLQGICSSPLVEGDRLWFVTSRGEVRCLDTAGFHDGEDDGAVQVEEVFVTKIDNRGENIESFAATLAGLESQTLSDQARLLLSDAGESTVGDVMIETVREGKIWKAVGNFGGVDRAITIKNIGPRIVFSKRLGINDQRDADVVWVYDMMGAELGISQRNMCSCSVTSYGDLLFVATGNGLDSSHRNIPAPNAPSFVCMNKHTGKVLWTDASPGFNILGGQWSSPTVGVFAGVPQVLFAGGDGFLYSFAADMGSDGHPKRLWEFDCNPKTSKWIVGGEGTRNNLIATPVVYRDNVYIAVGQDPEHGEGVGHLWCIDPSKRGDISPTLAMRVEDGKEISIPHRRNQAVIEEDGEIEADNPNSGAVWHYSLNDANRDGEYDFDEQMHRTIGTCVVKDDVLYVADFSGLLHCLDANGGENGKPIVHYTYDMLAQSWGSPLIADGHVFIGDEDGDVAIFEFGPKNNEPVAEINMGSSVYSTPIAANHTIFISTKEKLFSIRLPKLDVGR